MPIEVREIVIKSSVSAAPAERAGEGGAGRELERMKEELLAECRQMVLAMIRSERER